MNFLDILTPDEGRSPATVHKINRPKDFDFAGLDFEEKFGSSGVFDDALEMTSSQRSTRGSPEQPYIYSNYPQLPSLALTGEPEVIPTRQDSFLAQAALPMADTRYLAAQEPNIEVVRRISSSRCLYASEEFPYNKYTLEEPRQEPPTADTIQVVAPSFPLVLKLQGNEGFPIEATLSNSDETEKSVAPTQQAYSERVDLAKKQQTLEGMSYALNLNKRMQKQAAKDCSKDMAEPHSGSQQSPLTPLTLTELLLEEIEPSKRKGGAKNSKKPSKADVRKNTGFRRANDVAYLENSYDDLEKRMSEIQSQGRAKGVKSKEKQRMWNQVSSLKNRIWNKEHCVMMEGLARRKDREFAILMKELECVATPSQMNLIKARMEKKWTAIEADYAKKWPIEIREARIILKGEARPNVLGKRTKAWADSTRSNLNESSEQQDSGLSSQFCTPEFVYRHFQRNEEAEL